VNPGDPSLRITAGWRGDCRTLRLEGELDLSTASAVRDALAELLSSTDVGAVELDCRDLAYVDSTGLGVFVAAHKRAIREGVALRLVRPSPNIIRLLEVTGLRDFFHITEE
jgi:anti-anti-sigma factor